VSVDIAAPTAASMRELGTRLAILLRPGDVVVLNGSLGAGKTTLAQGIGAAMNVRGGVTSPTFVISRVHPPLAGGPALVHVDAYRIAGRLELDDLDLDASLADSITLVEWGEGLAEGLSGDRLEVTISRTEGDDAGETRTVHVAGVGRRWRDVDLTGLAGGPAGPG
jgi:tRNA threonylcarbamoyladenosine biosynthesis protein TsaE